MQGMNENINLNDHFWVKLNSCGRHAWIEFYRERGISTPVRTPDKDGWLRLPLWEIAQVFGNQLSMGFKDLPFETMDLFRDKP